MSFHLVPHLPRLVAMVAKFFMCERKVSNMIYYFFVILIILDISVISVISINNQDKQQKMLNSDP